MGLVIAKNERLPLKWGIWERDGWYSLVGFFATSCMYDWICN